MAKLENENSVDLLYSICRESIRTQIDQKNALETKANTLTAFAGGIFALLMGARNTLISLSSTSQFTIILSIIFFSVSVLLCTVVNWVRRYYVFPNLETLVSKYVNSAESDTKLQLISNLSSEWKTNTILLERNAWFLRIAFICQTIAFLLLGLALLLSI